MKFTFKKELETTDLIKSLVAISGAILAFYLITSIQLKNDNIRLKLELTKLIPKLQPHVQSNFSNLVNSDNSSAIDIKLYLKVLSDYYVYFHPPKVKLIKKGTDNEFYTGSYHVKGNNSYKGLFSPQTSYNINYQLVVDDRNIDFSMYDITFEFDIDTDQSIQNAFGKILNVLGENTLSEVDKLSYKTHKFRDQIYVNNKSFEVFFEQCSAR